MHTFVDGELLTAEQLNGNFQDIDTRTDSRLTALESSTSWVTFDANGEWKANSVLAYNRGGRTVHLQGKLQIDTSLGTSNYTNVFYIPAAVRPLRDVFAPVALRFVGATPNYESSAILHIVASTGAARLYTQKAGADAAFIGSVSWPI